MRKLVSIIIPAYNEAENVRHIFDKIKVVFDTLPYNWEVIFIDDGSKDETINTVMALSEENNNVYFLEFSKNFGHQLAVKAGLDNAYGDCVVSLDCDAQHPPEIIPDMLVK